MTSLTEKGTLSFRKIRFFALCKNANLSGIRFVFLAAKKPNRIPHKLSFAARAAKRKFCGMTGILNLGAQREFSGMTVFLNWGGLCLLCR
jgi:hypothetical protein